MEEVYEFLKKCEVFYLATEVLYFKNAKATFCSFTEEPKVIDF